MSLNHFEVHYEAIDDQIDPFEKMSHKELVTDQKTRLIACTRSSRTQDLIETHNYGSMDDE
jgi:hypothetical protein